MRRRDGISTDAPAQLNLRLLRPIIQFVRDRCGIDAVTDIAQQAGLDPRTLEGGSVWIALEQFEQVLRTVRGMVDSDEEFRAACSYRLIEGYGPFRFLVRATTPAAMFRAGARTFHLISRISSMEVTEHSPNRIEVRYTTSVREGRLVCLHRAAQMAAAPTLWGLPPARLEERGCVAHGDPACVYILNLYHRRRWMPIFAGGALGGLLASALWALSLQPSMVPTVILLGALFGYVYELRRTNRENLQLGEDVNEALRKLSREEAEARVEIAELHQRQRQWTELLEEQLSERDAAMHEIVQRIRRMTAERDSSLREVSHDLGSPLMGLLQYAAMLEEQGADPQTLADMTSDIDRMKLLLLQLMAELHGEQSVSWTHRPLDVAEITESLRRRLRALVFGRDIRVTVFRSREAPETVRCSQILFDRVVDNLLTNAAKYTSSGSIVVEVDGTPQYLTLKVSDTGRGIATDRIEEIFRYGGSDETTRAQGSFGVGLSVVVSLLAQIGGKLEVMSKPNVGTTFWAHFPIEPSETEGGRLESGEWDVGSVLTIRRSVDR